jgi:AraC-like DNA-binding protein
MRAMDYREYPVPRTLRRHVQCVWRLRDDAQPVAPRTIYPDGRCELIAHLGRPPQVFDADVGWRPQARQLFAAQQRSAIRLRARTEVDCLGVRLQPAASAAVVDSPGSWRDRITDLALIDAAFAARFAAEASQFRADSNHLALWALLEERLLPFEPDPRIEAAIARLDANGGRARIEAAASSAGMGLRSFQARFIECVGLGAKEYARLLRLQATIRALDGDDSPLSQVALDAGFADQAHATREVARVTGLTPAKLRSALRSDREGDDTIRLAAAFVRGRA